MMRSIIAAAVFCATALTLTGCGPREDTATPTANTTTETAATKAAAAITASTFTNIGDDASLHEVTSALTAAGIPQQDVMAFADQVRSLTSVTPPGALITTPTPLADATNDDGTIAQATDAQPRLTNCRITTFTLARSLITVGNPAGADASMLFIDHDQMNAQPPLFEDSRPLFDALYGRIPTTKAKDVTARTADVEKYLADHEVTYKQGKATVVDVYIHDTLDPQGYSFVGHTGILIDRGNDLLFVEKLAFDAPYRAITFPNREELHTYLMDTYDSSEGQDYGAPLIFENGTPMDT